MQQVLFRIPLRIQGWLPAGIPLYGFGTMLTLALIICIWLAGRRAEKDGVKKVFIQDLSIWLVVAGIIGARLASVWGEGGDIRNFFKLWDGGLVFYGSAIGGVIGYLAAYFFIIRRHSLRTWVLADAIAPSIAMGLCLGRVGCLLNGCCYGAVACPECAQVHFPFSSPPHYALVREGFQTAAGFTLAENEAQQPVVGAVELDSPAAQVAGLQAGDVITGVNGRPIKNYGELEDLMGREWVRGEQTLSLGVLRGKDEITLATFGPRTLGLHPTQLYETISMGLLFFVLMSYFPYRKNYGEVMAVMMVGYGLHRSLNELLRADHRPEGFEKYISLGLIAAGTLLWVWFRSRPKEIVTILPGPK
jgi:phosphatidylglycerol:prolipoprotein diacylglycerol transferase